MKHNITISDTFWGYYRDIVRKKMIPYQWDVLNDRVNIKIEAERNDDTIPTEKSHAMENFKIAAGLKKGHHYGWVFQDSDVYKWLEAVAYSLAETMDIKLKQVADEVVDIIAQAQAEDGYLSTYFTIEAPHRKFKCLAESHELYCAGHFMEAAVAYHLATGNIKVLDVACKLADCIDRNFGSEAGKIHGYDGHEEIEIGLLKLYRITAEERYLKLSKYFLMKRGTLPEFLMEQRKQEAGEPLIVGMERWPLSYYQIHKPVLQQESAEGHAVRLVYLCTAMADLAAETNDARFYQACQNIWRNIVDKRMYITGGIGSTVHGESFTSDYDLPNDTMYCETCASIGLIFFAQRMLENEANGEYADVMERALYNTVLAGMSLDGTHFFYVNPLEINPKKIKKDPSKGHVKTKRPEWLGCSCCPPNQARLIASIDQYIYTVKEQSVYANLFINSESELHLSDGVLHIIQSSDYPWDGKIAFHLHYEGSGQPIFALRIPGWAKSYVLSRNGKRIAAQVENGYVYFQGDFQDESINLDIDMEPMMWTANPKVTSAQGKVAIQRGPIVYCAEEVDNGEHLSLLSVAKHAKMLNVYEKQKLGGIHTLEVEGYRDENIDSCLYRPGNWSENLQSITIKMIPYYAWANRGENEMSVWLRMHTDD